MSTRRRRRSAYEPGAGVPSLSGLAVVPETGGTTATLSATLVGVGAGDVFFVVAPATATAPTGAQIVLGLDGDNAAAVWDATVAYNVVNSFTGPITGLAAEEDYVAYAVYFDGVDAYTTVASYAFTTLAAPVLPELGDFDLKTEGGEALETEGGEQLTLEQSLAAVLSGFNITPLAGGLTASFDVTTTALSGQFYIVTYLASASDPDEEQIELGLDGDDNPAVWASNVALSSIDDYIPGISGIVQNTAYKSRAVVRLSATPGDYCNIVSDSWTSADAAPILTSMLATATGATTALFSLITDDPGGSIKWGVYPAASTPTKANILAGTGGALDYGSVSVSGAGLYSVLDVTGLSAGTAYKVHVYHIDAGAAESSILTSSSFTTNAVGATNSQIAHNGSTTGTLTNLTATTAQTDPLGGSNAIKYGHNPAGVSTSCYVSLPDAAFGASSVFQFFIKKGAWPSSAAWIRWRVLGTTQTPFFALNLDTGATATVDARFTNMIVVPVGGGFYFVRFTTTLDGPDNQGIGRAYMGVSSNSITITTAGSHELTLYDFKNLSP
jgi:hypothetical protein